MGRIVKIPYTSVRGGQRFFEPRGRMRQHGFRPLALGKDDEQARRRAWSLYERWIAVRDREEVADDAPKSKDGASAAKLYPHGSIGEAWQKWIRSEEWARLAPSTRNKIWWEAWLKRIEPVFGDVHPDLVTMEDLSLWRMKIEAKSGADVAHKALKVWRALWRVLQALRYTQLSDPSAKVRNRQPAPRHQRFAHGEAMRLAKTAWRRGYRGLACIIVVAWDTGFAPVDCRTLRERHRLLDRATGRLVLDRSRDGRTKSGVAVIGTLSRFGDWMVRRYLADLGAGMTADAFLFRMRTGVPYGESRLGGDFATIREIAMPGDRRQLRDMRRSGVLEAFVGGADARDVSEKFGNSLDRSATLFRTYNPVDLEKVKAADGKRLAGRRLRNKGQT